MKLGASFSHTHLKYLGLNPLKAIEELKTLGLRWIRLSCYWDEIEKIQGEYSYNSIEPLVKYCSKNQINVLLSIGMKAQRWPEYYFPKWIADKHKFIIFYKITKNNKTLLTSALNYLENTVNYFKNYDIIKAWQVENEPLDIGGPKLWKISMDFLGKEVDLIKNLDPDRKILINVWGNELSKRKSWEEAVRLTDIIGIDIYLKSYLPYLHFFKKYTGPSDSLEKINKICYEIKSRGKKVWITELQAEPWEPDALVTKKDNPPSFSIPDFEKNVEFAKYFNPEIIFLWGFEYWYARYQIGDLRYWRKAERIIQGFTAKPTGPIR